MVWTVGVGLKGQIGRSMHFLRGKCGQRQRVLGWVPQEQRVPSGFAYLEIAVVIQTRGEVVTCCWVNFQTATQIKILWVYMPWGSSFLPPTNKQMTFLRMIFVFSRKLLPCLSPKHIWLFGQCDSIFALDTFRGHYEFIHLSILTNSGLKIRKSGQLRNSATFHIWNVCCSCASVLR